MPNWCFNQATFSHDNEDMMERFNAAVLRSSESDQKGICEEFFPYPADMVPPPPGAPGYDENASPDWYNVWGYNWCYDNWGVKWDLSEVNGSDGDIEFQSPWQPPIGFYRKMETLGFTVNATYWEPGDCFAGEYKDGTDNSYPMSSIAEFRALPRDLMLYIHDGNDEDVKDFFGWEDDDSTSIKYIKVASKEVMHDVLCELDKDEDKIICAICYAKSDEDDSPKVMVLHCRHIFHRKCIKKYFATNPDAKICPMCRRTVIVTHEDSAATDETPATPTSSSATGGAGTA